ncbi:hypothetical protein J4G02_17025 [Candidatus Poribacteria bacterium]|nr:hypothetical protein [Candidatus Poribacteria bacterium]
MKRHHIAAVFCLIFGGLLAYTRFHHGDMGGAIRTGILFALLGVFVFFYAGKVRDRLRPVVIALPVILVGLMAYRDFIDGNMMSVITASIVLILGGILTLFQDTSFIKEKIRPWLRPIPYIGLAVMFIITLLLLFRG